MLAKIRRCLIYIPFAAAALSWCSFGSAAVTPNNVLIAQGSDMVCVILYAYIFSLFGSIVAFLSDSPNRSLKKWALGVALSFPIFLVGGFLLLFTMAMAFRLQV